MAVVLLLKAFPFLLWLVMASISVFSEVLKACVVWPPSRFNGSNVVGSSKSVIVTSTFKPFFLLLC